MPAVPKLTPDQVEEIRALKTAEPSLTNAALGERFGVNETTISRVLNGKTFQPANGSDPLRKLTVLHADVQKDGAIAAIPHNAIARWKGNPRKTFDDAALVDLAASIKEKGILQNLVVRADPKKPGTFSIVAGERRWRAVGHLIKNAGFAPDHPLPCRVIEADDLAALMLAVIENVQRQDVKPIEEAEAYKALVDAGIGTDTIAARIGVTVRTVQLRLELVTKLAPPVQKALAAGTLPLDAARAMTVAPTERQKVLLDRFRQGHFSSAKEVRQAIMRDLPASTWAIFDPKLYTGETIVAEGNKRIFYFVDVAQAEKLQMAAIDAKVEELKKKHRRVEVYKGRRTFDDWEHEEAKPGDPNAFTAVEIYDDLQVKIHENVVRCPDAPEEEDPPADEPQRPKHPQGQKGGEPCEKRHLIHARQRKTVALQAAIARRPDVAIRLALLALLGGDEVKIKNDGKIRDDETVSPAVAATLQPVIDALKKANVKVHVRKRDGVAKIGSEWGPPDEDMQAAAFVTLLGLSDKIVHAAFAAAVARQCGSWNDYSPDYGDGPVAVALADSLFGDGDDRNIHTTPEDLEGLRKDPLAAVAASLGVAPHGSGKAIRDAVGKVLKSPDKMVYPLGSNAGRFPKDHVLPTLRFADPKVVKKAMAELAKLGRNPPAPSAPKAQKKAGAKKTPAPKKKPAAKPKAAAKKLKKAA